MTRFIYRILATTIATIAAMPSGTAEAQQPAPRVAAERRAQRYQIAMMEGVLERAVEHGATLTRDRLLALIPAEMVFIENARARGFRLDGYGVFFDVAVPGLEGTLPWSFRTLDRNNLGLASALSALRAHIQGVKDDNLDQALKRIELQVTPLMPAPVAVGVMPGDLRAAGPQTPLGAGASTPLGAGASTPLGAGASTPLGAGASTPLGAGDPASASLDALAQRPPDTILEDPDAAYQTEVRNALMDAMLDYSRGLNLAAAEWLGVGARGTQDRPPLGPASTDAQTVIIQVRGADLNAFLAGQISKGEARKRIEVKVF